MFKVGDKSLYCFHDVFLGKFRTCEDAFNFCKESLDFVHWTVEVDGVELDESYIRRVPGATMYVADMNRIYGVDENGICEFTVKEGKVFVMGDNRNHSSDSRDSRLGTVDNRYVIGKAVLLAFPGPDSKTGKMDFKRLGFLA